MKMTVGVWALLLVKMITGKTLNHESEKEKAKEEIINYELFIDGEPLKDMRLLIR